MRLVSTGLLALALAACTEAPPDDPGTTPTGTTHSDPGTTGWPGDTVTTTPTGSATTPPGTTTPPDQPQGCVPPGPLDTAIADLCDRAAQDPSVLDAVQVPGNGRVILCHSSGGTNFVETDSSIEACATHIGHACDIFPTTGC